MSSQSWLDYRIKRINYFLRVVLVSIIYYKHKQSITSTHTNYFDLVFKERQGQPLVELDNYTDPIQLVNVLLTLFSIPAHRRALLNPYEASHYNLPTPFVNIIVEFIFLPAILPTLSEKPAPKELRILQFSKIASRSYFYSCKLSFSYLIYMIGANGDLQFLVGNFFSVDFNRPLFYHTISLRCTFR